MPTKRKTTKRKKKGTRRNPLRRVPSYVLWTALAIIIVAYIAFFYKTFVGPYSFRWKALYGHVTYPDWKVRGLDISHYQGGIDWGELYKNKDTDFPLRFIFMKATEGGDLADATFVQNFDSAKAYGFVRGAYHFFNPSSDARKQAEFFIRNVQLKPGDLAPVLDVETKGKNKADLQRSVKTWLDVVEAHYGVKPILYTGYSFKQKYLSSPEFDEYPYWIAHYYVSELEYKGPWRFWQYTDVGRVDGIRGNVDCNIFNGTLQELHSLTIDADVIDLVGLHDNN
jgi:lysozyme